MFDPSFCQLSSCVKQKVKDEHIFITLCSTRKENFGLSLHFLWHIIKKDRSLSKTIWLSLQFGKL